MATKSIQRNAALAAWMRENGVTAAELAERVNLAIQQATGQPGNVAERSVFRWLSGENRSPQRRVRDALESVTGRAFTDLGFIPRRRPAAAQPAPSEDAVRRRTFISLATATTLAAAAPTTAAGARPTLGVADVNRLRERLSELWLADDQHGGGPVLEQRASALAHRTLSMQQNGSASQRVRSRLYALAAAFELAAMFAALDSRRFPEAQRHLEKAVTLAGMSGDTQVQHQAWRQAAQLSGQLGRYTDAMAAAEACAATRINKNDPLYASLTHSRIALAASNLGDRPRAERALERASAAIDRADLAAPRPSSVAFYTPGELHGLSGLVHYRLGIADQAEAHTHQCLAALREDQHRNRAYYRAHAALTQVAQGDLEQAVATAASVVAPSGAPGGRVTHLLQSFTSALQQAAPGTAVNRDWKDFIRTVDTPPPHQGA
ncbi:hypothetical protein [Kribbella deserti]|uniref:XRE family transcriptional regulator n=1 Tax=Kribbella deserti TaxID=1926257 RepID=A0ABV6QGM8_9ACTN